MCSSTGKRSYNTSFRRLMAMFLAPLTSHLEQVKTSFPFTGVSLPQTPHVCEVYSSVQISRVHFVSKHFAFNLSLNKKCFSCNKSRFIPLIFLLIKILSPYILFINFNFLIKSRYRLPTNIIFYQIGRASCRERV